MQRKITLSLAQLLEMLVSYKDETGNQVFSSKQVSDALCFARDKAMQRLLISDVKALEQFAITRGEIYTKHAFAEKRLPKAYRSTYDFLERIGVRPEDVISFAPSIWTDWQMFRVVEFIAGTHLGSYKAGIPHEKSQVASFFDLQGMIEFNSFLQQNVVGLQTKFRIENPVVTEDAPYATLRQAVNVNATITNSTFTFGSPCSCPFTVTVASRVLGSQGLPEYVPKIWISHKREQFLCELFRIEPKQNVEYQGGLVHRATNALIRRDLPEVEDFAFIGVRLPEQNAGPILGFAAGWKQEGTLAAARALPRVIEDLYHGNDYEHLIRLDSNSAIAMIRVCFSQQDSLSDRLFLNPEISLNSTEKDGWNFITKNEMSLGFEQ